MYGRFDYNKEILVGPRKLNNQVGYDVITLLRLKKGGNVLVNRGWIAGKKKESVQESHARGRITVAGIFRRPDWNSFTPNNSPENNVWTKIDIKQISEEMDIDQLAPVVLHANNSSKDFSGLTVRQEKWFPRNKHKQYAMFWFSMTFVFVVIFGIFIWQNRQKRPS